MTRPRVGAEPEASFPQPAKEPKQRSKWLSNFNVWASWASGGKACVQRGIALHCCDRGKHRYSTAAAEFCHSQHPVAFPSPFPWAAHKLWMTCGLM